MEWPRSQAVQFMKDHVLESDTQIHTETLRYSTDLPAQALGYKRRDPLLRRAINGFSIDLQDMALAAGLGATTRLRLWPFKRWLTWTWAIRYS